MENNFTKKEKIYLIRSVEEDLEKRKRSLLNTQNYIKEKSPSDPYYERQVKAVSNNILFLEKLKEKLS